MFTLRAISFGVYSWCHLYCFLLKKNNDWGRPLRWYVSTRHIYHLIVPQWVRKFKKIQAKKLVKSNKSISRNFILTKFHFLQFQKWPKINFWSGGKFKTAKTAISRNTFLIYLISRVFLNFLARAVPFLSVSSSNFSRIFRALCLCVCYFYNARTKRTPLLVSVGCISSILDWKSSSLSSNPNIVDSKWDCWPALMRSDSTSGMEST